MHFGSLISVCPLTFMTSHLPLCCKNILGLLRLLFYYQLYLLIKKKIPKHALITAFYSSNFLGQVLFLQLLLSQELWIGTSTPVHHLGSLFSQSPEVLWPIISLTLADTVNQWFPNSGLGVSEAWWLKPWEKILALLRNHRQEECLKAGRKREAS